MQPFRLFGFAETFLPELGDFFDEALHLSVIGHRLADAVRPRLSDADLPRFAIMAPNQIKGSM
jgi:hypothetical protein